MKKMLSNLLSLPKRKDVIESKVHKILRSIEQDTEGFSQREQAEILIGAIELFKTRKVKELKEMETSSAVRS